MSLADLQSAPPRLKTYNIGDVELTEWLADRLRPWLAHPHTQIVDDDICPNCGSTDLKRRATNYTAVLIDYTQFTCQGCGKHLKGAWHARRARVAGIK